MVKNVNTYSATMVQDYLDCKRRFEYKYILGQSWPAIVSEPLLMVEEHIRRGKDFHFLIHQFFSGLPLATIQKIDCDEVVSNWFERFSHYIEQFDFKLTFSELRLQSHLSSYNLAAVYDLVALSSESSLTIFDWKTSLKEPRKNQLQSKMQTAFYPLVLWNNFDELIRANVGTTIEKIKMIYWYPEFPDRPKEFIYDKQKHLETQQYLSSILDEISESITNNEFSLATNDYLCKYCQYRSLCERGISAGNIIDEYNFDESTIEISIDFDAIEEFEPDIE